MEKFTKPPLSPLGEQELPHWKQEIVSIICQYEWDCQLAVAVFYAESGLNPDAIGDNGTSYGIAQLHTKTSFAGWDNPEVNIKMAYEGWYVKRGWRPWSAYTNGSYKRYTNLIKE